MLTPYRPLSRERHEENQQIGRTATELSREADRDANNELADQLLAEVQALGPLNLVDAKTYKTAMDKLMRSLRLRRG
jgi:hypothetical protein